jgi:hypothetical protein
MNVEAAYAAVRRRRELAGQAPLGPFGEAAARRDLARLADWEARLRELGAAGPWTRIALGRGTAAAQLVPALGLDVEVGGRVRRVELVGTTELVGGAGLSRSLVLVRKAITPEHRLRHALDHLVLAAADLAGGIRDGIVLGEGADRRRLRPWSRDEARAHLALLAGDLLGQPHAYVLRRVAEHEGIPPLGYGPLVRDPGLPIPDDVDAIRRRRLAPILDREVAS